ncbi:hypothetical protein [Bacillus massilioanorexius]|uniref:hypothetical protein n=1 Tax=Bacillus massilioanorexius TaxID=1468413 RepID=UPI001CA34521|nr:hypothetical protein [Bacillus massilioanorexius]
MPTISDNMSADVVRDMNALAEAVDSKVASSAELQSAGNAIQGQITTLSQEVTTHKADYLSHTGYANVTGSANAYIATLSPALSAYAEGVSLRVKINVDNTGAATLNVNGLGVKAIKKANGSDVNAGQLKANGVYTLSYNGTAFILQGEGSELSDAEMTNIINAVNGILGA